jgi:hypothetical protein
MTTEPASSALSFTESDEISSHAESSTNRSRAVTRPLSASCAHEPVPYCAGCGHDSTRHRNGRCWTGAMGEPLARTRSLIDCRCDRFEEDQ